MTDLVPASRGSARRSRVERDLTGRARHWDHAVNDVSASRLARARRWRVGRRVRRREVDRGPARVATDRARRGTINFDGGDVRALSRAGSCGWRREARSDDLPGPVHRRSTHDDRSARPWRSRSGFTRAAGPDARAGAGSNCRAVGIGAHHLDRYPHEFSGGQLQRIAIARAIGDQAAAGGVRRAGRSARRVDPCPGHQPAARDPGRAGIRVPLHLARPLAGAADRRQRHRDVQGRDRGAGARPGRCSTTQPSVHAC